MQWEGLKNGLVADVIPVLQMVVQNTDTIKAVAVAAAAAIGTKLVVQGAILAGTFTMAAIRAGVMEATLVVCRVQQLPQQLQWGFYAEQLLS